MLRNVAEVTQRHVDSQDSMISNLPTQNQSPPTLQDFCSVHNQKEYIILINQSINHIQQWADQIQM